jgi:quercetin dioxygenase-like cupin family protein
MSLPPAILEAISDEVLVAIRDMSPEEFSRVLLHQDYHDFGKDDFTGGFIESILIRHGLSKKDVQIDIISVNRDLTHQVHFHREAHAFLVVLGPLEHVAAPRTAEAYLGERWFPVSAGRVLSILPGTPHGFRVQENSGDVLRFLSVQSPPIVRNGEDDYYLCVKN